MKKDVCFCLTLILCLLLPGCSSEDMGNSPDDSLVEIHLSGGIGSEASVSTRGTGMINGTATWTAKLPVSFARADKATDYSSGYLGTPLSGNLNEAPTSGIAHAITFNPSAYYQADGKSSKLIGWYPSTGTFTQNNHIVAFSTDILDGSTDLMVTDLYEGSKSSTISSVTFNHLLTQISVRVYTESSTTATVWGNLTSITIIGMKQSCTVTLPAASAAVTGGTEKVTAVFSGIEALPLVKQDPSDNSTISSSIELGVGSDNAVLAGYAMFAPQISGTSSENDIQLAVVTSVGGEHTATVSAPTGGFKAGYSYVVTLKFGATGITPSVSITDWVTSPDNPGEVDI